MKTTLIKIVPLLIATVAVAGCMTNNDGPHRPDSDIPQHPEQTIQVNPDWKITYSGRQDYTEDNGSRSEVDGITVTSVDNEHYYLDIISNAQFESTYGNDLLAYLKDELDMVSQTVKDYGSSYDAETYVGTQTILFDRFRSGKWRAVAFGISSKGNLTGDYAILDFTIEEETPTENYLRWTGEWQFTGKSKKDGNTDITYNVNISSEDANYLYTIRGWETGEGLRNDMSNYSIEAIYDKFNGTMYFKGLYLETYTENDESYDFCFFGNFMYDGSAGFTDMTPGEYTITDYVAIAEAFMISDESASIESCGLDFSHDGTIYGTKFTSMQYFDLPYSTNNIFTYNDDVPEFPITMSRASSLTMNSAALTPTLKALRIRPSRIGEKHSGTTSFRKVSNR